MRTHVNPVAFFFVLALALAAGCASEKDSPESPSCACGAGSACVVGACEAVTLTVRLPPPVKTVQNGPFQLVVDARPIPDLAVVYDLLVDGQVVASGLLSGAFYELDPGGLPDGNHALGAVASVSGGEVRAPEVAFGLDRVPPRLTWSVPQGFRTIPRGLVVEAVADEPFLPAGSGDYPWGLVSGTGKIVGVPVVSEDRMHVTVDLGPGSDLFDFVEIAVRGQDAGGNLLVNDTWIDQQPPLGVRVDGVPSVLSGRRTYPVTVAGGRATRVALFVRGFGRAPVEVGAVDGPIEGTVDVPCDSTKVADGPYEVYAAAQRDWVAYASQVLADRQVDNTPPAAVALRVESGSPLDDVWAHDVLTVELDEFATPESLRAEATDGSGAPIPLATSAPDGRVVRVERVDGAGLGGEERVTLAPGATDAGGNAAGALGPWFVTRPPWHRPGGGVLPTDGKEAWASAHAVAAGGAYLTAACVEHRVDPQTPTLVVRRWENVGWLAQAWLQVDASADVTGFALAGLGTGFGMAWTERAAGGPSRLYATPSGLYGVNPPLNTSPDADALEPALVARQSGLLGSVDELWVAFAEAGRIHVLRHGTELAGFAPVGAALTPDGVVARTPAITLGPDPIVASVEASGGGEWIVVREWSAGTWAQLGEALGPITGAPALSASGGERVVAWTERVDAGTRVHVATWDAVAGTWVEREAPCGVPAVEPQDPAVAHAPDGTLHLAWRERVDGTLRPRLATWRDAGWMVSPPVDGPSDAGAPAIAAGALGGPVLVWTEAGAVQVRRRNTF